MTAEKVPFGTKQVVILGLEDRASGDDRFAPIGILAASGSGGSGVPSLSVVPEMPETDGGTDRLIPNALSLITQQKAAQTTDVIAQHVAGTLYPYDPAQTLLSQRVIQRGTGGLLSAATVNYTETASTNDDGNRLGQDIRAFLYGVNFQDTAEAGRLSAAVGSTIVSHIVTNLNQSVLEPAADVTIGTTATQLTGSNNATRRVHVQNIGTTNNLRIGPQSGVTITQGIRLAPGEKFTLETNRAVFGIAESGTTVVAMIREKIDPP